MKFNRTGIAYSQWDLKIKVGKVANALLKLIQIFSIEHKHNFKLCLSNILHTNYEYTTALQTTLTNNNVDNLQIAAI